MTHKLALMMYTDAEQAKYFGVSPEIFRIWGQEHPEFIRARVRGREVADAPVVAALRDRALGYEHQEEKVFLGPNGQIITHETTKRYAPDTRAAELWLSNRQPDKWKMRGQGYEPGEKGGTEIRITGGLPEGEK
jgi:hypothetical protein